MVRFVFHAKKKKILSKQAQLFLSAYMRAVKTQESKAANITHKEQNSPINSHWGPVGKSTYLASLMTLSSISRTHIKVEGED